jgi:tetratricopeptide (TPR) repeat protein
MRILIIFFLIAGIVAAFMVRPAKITKNTVSSGGLAEILKTTTPVPTPSFINPPVSHTLPSAKWVPQSFNNCGPAATSMVLQYFGYNVPQTETKSKLRTNADDKNVFIEEIAEYLKRDYQIENRVMINGDLETLKTLLANDIYIVVEAWLRPNEDIGHVLIIRGYDDGQEVLIGDDSYFGTGIKYPYKTWEETQWKPYGLEYMPVYKSEKEELVRAIIGENWNEKTMHANSVKDNLEVTQKNQNDAFAWFNLGASYYALGKFNEAKTAFEKADAVGLTPRMLWYRIQPVQTYNKLGEYAKAIQMADRGLRGNDTFAELHYEKAIAFKSLGNMNAARLEAEKSLGLDANFEEAKIFLNDLNN